MAAPPLPAVDKQATEELVLVIDESNEHSVLGQLGLPEGSPYKQSSDVVMEYFQTDKGAAAQVIIMAKPGSPDGCEDKHLSVVWLVNFLTGPSVPMEQNRLFRGLATSLLANMLGWIKKERPHWLLDGEKADETIVGIEAKNQRNTVCRSFVRQRSVLSEEDKEARYLADVRDQNGLERHYEKIGFTEDERFIDENNTGTKGYSARLGALIKSLREAVPNGVISTLGEPK
jgi:hypothetical protein